MPETLSWVWRAFEDLSTCRGVGMALGPIPWTAVHEYAKRYGIEGDAFEKLTVWLRMMESAADEQDNH